MAPQPRRTFPPLITASKWETAWQACWKQADARRGSSKSASGNTVPRVTNGDMAAVVQAFARLSRADFPLWYQFGAAAYGWNPKRPDRFVTTDKQRDARVDVELAKELWLATLAVAKAMDARPLSLGARLDMQDAFSDPVFQSEIKAEMVQDGATAQGKIPICTERPKLKCREGFDLVQVSPGIFVCKNKKTGEVEQPRLDCEPIWVDDPITAVGKDVLRAALILGSAWFVLTHWDD